MKLIISIFILSISLFGLDWKSYEDGAREAEAQCKPMVLVVHKKDCPACTKLFKDIRKSALLKNVLEDYVVMQIETTEAAKKYGTQVSATPTIFIMNAGREEVLRPIVGLPADNLEFVDYLQLGIVASSSYECKSKTNNNKF